MKINYIKNQETISESFGISSERENVLREVIRKEIMIVLSGKREKAKSITNIAKKCETFEEALFCAYMFGSILMQYRQEDVEIVSERKSVSEMIRGIFGR